MTDARKEWISKRAYTLWEEAGYPDGQDGAHWAQAERERDDFEKVGLSAKTKTAKAKKPVIELSGKTVKAAPKKKAATPKVDKPVAAKAVATEKVAKAKTNGKEI